MSQKPSVTRIVMAEGPRARSNGSESAPAIITKVHSKEPDDKGRWLVNATIFRDGGSENAATSLYLYADRTAATEAREQNVHATVLYWPERVA